MLVNKKLCTLGLLILGQNLISSDPKTKSPTLLPPIKNSSQVTKATSPMKHSLHTEPAKNLPIIKANIPVNKQDQKLLKELLAHMLKVETRTDGLFAPSAHKITLAITLTRDYPKCSTHTFLRRIANSDKHSTSLEWDAFITQDNTRRK